MLQRLPRRRTSNPRPRGAFTLVELLLSMCLMAVLLTSLGFAVNASMKSYTSDIAMTNLTRTSRLIMDRMTRDVRTARNVDCASNTLKIYPLDANVAPEVDYVLQSGSFIYRKINGTTITDYPLLSSTDPVTPTAFTINLSYTTLADGNSYATLASLKLSLKAGTQTMTVTGSASPRRNITH